MSVLGPSFIQPVVGKENKPRIGSKKDVRYVGAIDIGTNSTHLLIAAVDPVLRTFSVELAEKSTTRLGERDQESGKLTEVAIKRALEALRNFKALAFSYKVEELIMAATSAVRESSNGSDFLSQVKEELDLDIDLISGPEEARLIYLGVLSGMPFGEKPHLVLDIGGGSTELVLADGKDAKALTSTRIGAVRLQRDFIRKDTLSSARSEFIKAFIQGSLEPAVDKISRRINSGEKPIMIATSGSALAIGALVANGIGDSVLKFQGYKISKESLDKLIEKLLKMSSEQIRKLPSISSRRAEIIVPGALILQTAMQMMGVKEVVLSERALREGLVVDWMFRKKLLEDRFSLQGSIRRRTVMHQARRFAVDNARSVRVARHALSLYDNSKGYLHNDKGEGRDLLWAAAMLHSCGQHINLSSYHKHSWYLIRHGELLGYSQVEHLIVAAIARYHRRSLPKKRHEAWQVLGNKKNRKIASEMSLLLRLASAIDRRPEPVVASIDITIDKQKLVFRLIPEKLNQNISLEKWSLNNCIAIIKELTGFESEIIENKHLNTI